MQFYIIDRLRMADQISATFVIACQYDFNRKNRMGGFGMN